MPFIAAFICFIAHRPAPQVMQFLYALWTVAARGRGAPGQMTWLKGFRPSAATACRVFIPVSQVTKLFFKSMKKHESYRRK